MRVDGISGVVRYERVALPDDGGMNEQDARTMAALRVLEFTAVAVLEEQREKAKKTNERGSRPVRTRRQA